MKATLLLNLKQLLIFIGLILLSLFLSGFAKNSWLSFLPLGCILVVLSNWLMFRWEGLSLAYLGINKKQQALAKILVGFVLGLCFVFLGLCLQSIFKGGSLRLNPALDVKALFKALMLVLPTVVVQQFYIMGYGFYKTKQIGGHTFSILLTAIVFTCMHDVWGNPWNVPFHLINYFFAVFIYATALQRSGSILLPIGLHWANNFATSYLITENETKTSLVFLADKPNFIIENYSQYFGFLALGLIAPSILVMVIRMIYKNKDQSSVSL